MVSGIYVSGIIYIWPARQYHWKEVGYDSKEREEKGKILV